VGSAIEGPITSITKFGAFVQLADGIEGMVHVSEISAEKHLQHPQDLLHVGQVVKAQILEMDKAKRQLRLSMKQRTAVGVDEYLAEHPVGSTVTGRIVESGREFARVELGEGLWGTCKIAAAAAKEVETPSEGKVDLSSLSSMLKARWKGGPSSSAAKPETLQAGQIRSFRVAQSGADAKMIGLELV
jgi:small subunit ribosomal protein S1